jgi:hypothetical protein
MFPRLVPFASWPPIGRENACGGEAAARLKFPPSIEVRVGRTLAKPPRSGVARLSSFGETLIRFRATDIEFTSVLRETAVNPPGAWRLA